MDEEISKNLFQIKGVVDLDANQTEIVKLVLEKTYIQGMQEGSARVFEKLEKNLTK